MASRRLPPQDQTETIIFAITDDLRRMIPGLVNQSHAFGIKFIIHIRDGLITLLETDAFDDAWEPLIHVRDMPPDVGVKKIEQHLHKNMPTRLVSGYHGQIMLRVVVLKDTLSFAFRSHKQRKFDWGS